MTLKITPKINLRYWISILIASMCGTNFGDFFVEVLKIGTTVSLIILIVLFIAVFVANNLSKHGNEAFYWLAILVVRAAATNIADFTIATWHFSYLTVGICFAIIIFLLVYFQPKTSYSSENNFPVINGYFWLTMLTAGSFGTIIGDGFYLLFENLMAGFLTSAVVATLTVITILLLRKKLNWFTPASYWIAIVAVRWWGTNFGDMLGFILTIWGSMIVTALALLLTLYFWKTNYSRKLDRQ